MNIEAMLAAYFTVLAIPLHKGPTRDAMSWFGSWNHTLLPSRSSPRNITRTSNSRMENSTSSLRLSDAAGAEVPQRVWVVWFGSTISGPRATNFARLQRTLGVPVTMVTEQNLESFVLSDQPLHPAFEFLTAIHKSDYLAAYLAHHYGGGWHDIKRPHPASWIPYFAKFRDRSSLWVFGPAEREAGHVACQRMPCCAALPEEQECADLSGDADTPRQQLLKTDPWEVDTGKCCARVRSGYSQLVTVQAFIVRPRTRFTAEWLTLVNRRLDAFLDLLRQHPSPYPRCCKDHDDGCAESELHWGAPIPASHAVPLPPARSQTHSTGTDSRVARSTRCSCAMPATWIRRCRDTHRAFHIAIGRARTGSKSEAGPGPTATQPDVHGELFR